MSKMVNTENWKLVQILLSFRERKQGDIATVGLPGTAAGLILD